jgi:tetratricopeptide (TPR) repeat protein
LGDDEKAVDAAAAAVVSWGSNQSNRKHALDQLKSSITSVKDLGKFIKSLDAKADKTGEDSPLLRKMAGAVLQQRGDFTAAISQYRLSLELQPFDRDVHQWLLECFDKLNDNEAAVEQLLAQIDFDRHNLALYQSLAKRTKDNARLAERASTSIIEQAPSEAESYAALAEFRQEQNRWNEAIPLWTRVSELRKLEPTGLLGLAKAQLHQKQIPAAKETLNQLRRKEWPAHFGEIDQKVRDLEKQLP